MELEAIGCFIQGNNNNNNNNNSIASGLVKKVIQTNVKNNISTSITANNISDTDPVCAAKALFIDVTSTIVKFDPIGRFKIAKDLHELYEKNSNNESVKKSCQDAWKYLIKHSFFYASISKKALKQAKKVFVDEEYFNILLEIPGKRVKYDSQLANYRLFVAELSKILDKNNSQVGTETAVKYILSNVKKLESIYLEYYSMVEKDSHEQVMITRTFSQISGVVPEIYKIRLKRGLNDEKDKGLLEEVINPSMNILQSELDKKIDRFLSYYSSSDIEENLNFFNNVIQKKYVTKKQIKKIFNFIDSDEFKDSQRYLFRLKLMFPALIKVCKPFVIDRCLESFQINNYLTESYVENLINQLFTNEIRKKNFYTVVFSKYIHSFLPTIIKKNEKIGALVCNWIKSEIYQLNSKHWLNTLNEKLQKVEFDTEPQIFFRIFSDYITATKFQDVIDVSLKEEFVIKYVSNLPKVCSSNCFDQLIKVITLWKERTKVSSEKEINVLNINNNNLDDIVLRKLHSENLKKESLEWNHESLKKVNEEISDFINKVLHSFNSSDIFNNKDLLSDYIEEDVFQNLKKEQNIIKFYGFWNLNEFKELCKENKKILDEVELQKLLSHICYRGIRNLKELNDYEEILKNNFGSYMSGKLKLKITEKLIKDLGNSSRSKFSKATKNMALMKLFECDLWSNEEFFKFFDDKFASDELKLGDKYYEFCFFQRALKQRGLKEEYLIKYKDLKQVKMCLEEAVDSLIEKGKIFGKNINPSVEELFSQLLFFLDLEDIKQILFPKPNCLKAIGIDFLTEILTVIFRKKQDQLMDLFYDYYCKDIENDLGNASIGMKFCTILKTVFLGCKPKENHPIDFFELDKIPEKLKKTNLSDNKDVKNLNNNNLGKEKVEGALKTPAKGKERVDILSDFYEKRIEMYIKYVTNSNLLDYKKVQEKIVEELQWIVKMMENNNEVNLLKIPVEKEKVESSEEGKVEYYALKDIVEYVVTDVKEKLCEQEEELVERLDKDFKKKPLLRRIYKSLLGEDVNKPLKINKRSFGCIYYGNHLPRNS